MRMQLVVIMGGIALPGLGVADRFASDAENTTYDPSVAMLLISLEIVAPGASLAELAASSTGTLENQHDLVVGNMIGPNKFNFPALPGLSGLISQGRVVSTIVIRSMSLLNGLATALIFLLSYLSYQSLLYFSAENQAAKAESR